MLPALYGIEVSQQLFHSVVLSWRHTGDLVNGAQPLTAEVDVYRSYVEHAGFELIGTAVMANKFFVDDEVHPASRWTYPYYKLVAKNGSSEKTYGPVHLKDAPDPISTQIIHNVHLMLSNSGAVPVLIYQHAYGDASKRCPKCWDEVSQAVISSHCDTCQGTGFVTDTTSTGYYSPILTLANIRPAKLAERTSDVAALPQSTTATVANFPRLRAKDLIRELNSTNMWSVASIQPFRKEQLLIYQEIEMHMLDMAQIELELPIPDTIVPVLSRKKARKERVIIHNVGEEPKALNIWV